MLLPSFFLEGKKKVPSWICREEVVMDCLITVMQSFPALVTPVISWVPCGVRRNFTTEDQRNLLAGSCSEWARWGVLASVLLCNPAAVLR